MNYLVTPHFKCRLEIAIAGAVYDTYWYLEGFKRSNRNFTIPATTPPGKYLLRHEQIWPKALPSTYVRASLFIQRKTTTDENSRTSDVSFTLIACRSISLVQVEVSHNLVCAAQRSLFNSLIAGTPGPTVKFPGECKIEDPKIHIPDDIELPYDKDKGLL